MSSPSLGLTLIVTGLILALVGLMVYWGGLGWFGRLPGDIRVERENMRIYIPFVSMIVVSLVLSIIAYVVRRFF